MRVQNCGTLIVYNRLHSKLLNMIKKIICLTALLLALTSVNVNADSYWDDIHFEFVAGLGNKSNSITPSDFASRIHTKFISRTYLFVSLENNLALYENNSVKTYYSGFAGGGGIGVKLFGAKEESSSALDLRAQVVGSVDSVDWKRTSYELSLAYYLKSRWTPVIELGYRYTDSRTGLGDFGRVYLRLGLRY